MSVTSTIRNTEATPVTPTLAILNEGESAPAAAPKSNVTVIDARTATVRDSEGRLLKVRRLSAIDRVKLFRAMGAVDAENRAIGSYAATAVSVTAIDDMPVTFPQSSISLDALITRLDTHGLEAAVTALVAIAIDADTAETAKK
jgi:hypothetical protein